MPTFWIRVQETALNELDSAYEWISEESPTAAINWYNGCIEAIESLSVSPKRCPLAPENSYFKEEIRQLLYGKRRHAYRILFTVRNDRVHVLHVRHGSRDWLHEEGEVCA